MKTKFFSLFFLIALISEAQTSVYNPFPEVNASWNVHFSLSCFTGYADERYSILFSGDTLLNNQVYHKLTVPYVESFTSGVCNGIGSGYRGAIRQDSLLRKVFIVAPSDTLEQLLFDFTMQVGDTIKGFLSSAFSPEIVQSVDSVLIGSNYRTRWNINQCYNVSLIEGVGSTYGLMVPSFGCILDGPDYSISCFRQNDITLYPDANSDCQLIDHIYSINDQNKIRVFPNPSVGYFNIESNNVKEVYLFDAFGKIVSPVLFAGDTNIKVTLHQEGIFFLKLLFNDGSFQFTKIENYQN